MRSWTPATIIFYLASGHPRHLSVAFHDFPSRVGVARTRCAKSAFQLSVVDSSLTYTDETDICVDRPLLKAFGKSVNKRIQRTKEGQNRIGQERAFASHDTIPCLEMASCQREEDGTRLNYSNGGVHQSSKLVIQKAFSADGNPIHQLGSSGSGCAIICLRGTDATSIKGLDRYSKRFFDKVDEDTALSSAVKNVGVMKFTNHVYAGFDPDVNEYGKMQFLDTRIMPATERATNAGLDDSFLIPLEVGELVGTSSLKDAQRGMETLLDIGLQVTSAVLGMDKQSTNKLIDSASHQSSLQGGNAVSNSYHRLIRYMKPSPSVNADAAFNAHVDSSFLTLIPMPDRPGLEVWCPRSTPHDGEKQLGGGGEWVRLMTPPHPDSASLSSSSTDDCAYVMVLAGEFLELLSDGRVPVCIHRVIAPPATASSETYKARISAPMFLRPRRCEDTLLNIHQDLNFGKTEAEDASSSQFGSLPPNCNSPDRGMYYREGLVDECDGMQLWSVHNVLK